MNLFNRKTLKRHIKPEPIPADHLAALDAWADMIRSGRVYALKETALHGQFAATIVENVLGYRGPAGGADYTVATEQAILRGSVDLALGRFGGKTPEILAPFELKGADTRDLDAIMPGRNKKRLARTSKKPSPKSCAPMPRPGLICPTKPPKLQASSILPCFLGKGAIGSGCEVYVPISCQLHSSKSAYFRTGLRGGLGDP